MKGIMRLVALMITFTFAVTSAEARHHHHRIKQWKTVQIHHLKHKREHLASLPRPKKKKETPKPTPPRIEVPRIEWAEPVESLTKVLYEFFHPRTAVYNIAEHKLALPSGLELEAHSGLGHRRDDPAYVRARNRGPTPPNEYQLVMREHRFHGVTALRLIPTDKRKMHGRDGILAHPYFGKGGQSHGCVAVRNYKLLLSAFVRGEVNKVIVVPGG
jgi:hypothetical protein